MLNTKTTKIERDFLRDKRNNGQYKYRIKEISDKIKRNIGQ